MTMSVSSQTLKLLKWSVLWLGLGLLFPKILPAENTAFSLQPQDLIIEQQPRATTSARRSHLQEQQDRIAPERFDLQRYPVTDANETQWRQTLWATALLEPQSPIVIEAITQILELAMNPNLSSSQAKTVQMAMQVGTQLYLGNPQKLALIGDRFQNIVKNSPDPEWSVMALSALVQAGLKPALAQTELQQLQSRFQWVDNFAIKVALQDISEQLKASSLPPLQDLLAWQIAPPSPQLYVFCRPNRGLLCRAIVKDGNGQFRRETSQPQAPLWSVPLLTRSLHGLRWNFVRGQTPQGIYRIEGTMPRPSATYFTAYGQFPLVKVFMPFESGVQNFIATQPDQMIGDLNSYYSLLPSSWRQYAPIAQTYWAGRLGRSLIRIHGSGESTSFFVNNQRFPQSDGWNPAIGCLSAQEIYDQTGQLTKADMPNILKTLAEVNGGKIEGYLIVVEIPTTSKQGTNQPVSLAEIEAALQK